jgi:hypothetical protein
VPGKTILDIPDEEQEQMLRQLRQARYGYLLSIHILLLCAQGHTPSEIATFLLCSRSSVYRSVVAYQRGEVVLGGVSDSQAPALLSWHRSLVGTCWKNCRVRKKAKGLSVNLDLEPRSDKRATQIPSAYLLNSTRALVAARSPSDKDVSPEVVFAQPSPAPKHIYDYHYAVICASDVQASN